MVELYQYCPYCRTELKPVGRHRHCPGCGVTLYQNVSAAAGIILINDRGEALLARRAKEPDKGAFGVTGGFIEPGESALEGAAREVREETGLTDFTVLDLLGTWPDRYANDAYTLNIIFVARLHSGTPHPNDDVSALEWHPITDLPRDALEKAQPNNRQAFQQLQDWYHKHKEEGTTA